MTPYARLLDLVLRAAVWSDERAPRVARALNRVAWSLLRRQLSREWRREVRS